MKSAFLQELLHHRAEITRRWRVALQEAPVYTALGNADTLAFLIEPTLNQLFDIARTRPEATWSPQMPPSSLLVEPASRCAINPMIGYYLAGESALTGTVRGMRATDSMTETDILVSEGELLAILRSLGRVEITQFCEICRIEVPSTATARVSLTVPATCPFKASQARRHPPLDKP
ncbi:MAG: hypothetical protein QM760_17455 [Nibricoccus sp.]